MSLPLANHEIRLFLCACAMPVLAGCDANGRREAPEPAFSVSIEQVRQLHPSEGVGLASANSLALDPDGRLYVGDASDRAIKVFAVNGVQGPSIGGAGAGPGEFLTLLSAGTLGDSVFAWDGTENRLSMFAPDGRYVRVMPLHLPGSPPWSRMRAMDDSLLVASGWAQGVSDRPLVEVFDRRGNRVGRMMNLSRLLSPPDPNLLPHTAVFADGSEGVVFSTLHGFDTLMAYTPHGRLLGAGRIGLKGHSPVLDLRQLLAHNGGKLKRRDGTWAQDGHYAALKLVALGDRLVAVQFGLMDLRHGTDLLSDGGPVVVLRVESDGVIRRVAQVEAPGALLGRSGRGQALILRWSGSNLEQLDLFRLTVRAKNGGAS